MPKRERDFEDKIKQESEEAVIKSEFTEDEREGHLGLDRPSSSEAPQRTAKKQKPSAGQTNDEGNTYFELGPKKRITVSRWKNKPLIDIREYYEGKDSAMKPGKKGISLTVEQFRNILKYADEINNIIESLE